MKTAKQIRRYLRKQVWYKPWLKFTWRAQTLEEFLVYFLGFKNENTLRGFVWRNTVHGASFWNKADNDFRSWYHGKE